MFSRKDKDQISDRDLATKMKGSQKSAVKSSSSPVCSPSDGCAQGQEHPWDLSQKSTGRAGRTRITVRYDVGFNNTLCIRGKGAGLSWDKGMPLRNVERDLWVWETEAPFTVAEFKVLINDQLYEEGANHTLKCGAQLEFTPHFQASKSPQ